MGVAYPRAWSLAAPAPRRDGRGPSPAPARGGPGIYRVLTPALRRARRPRAAGARPPRLGAAAVGAVFLVAAVFEAAIHPLLGRWSDRAGHRPPILAGLLTSLAVLLALPWAPTAPLLALLVVLAGVAFNAPLVPGTVLFSRSAEKVGIEGALAFGAANFAWASGYAAGASLGGFLADLGGDALSYLSLAAVCLLALLLLRRASLSA